MAQPHFLTSNIDDLENELLLEAPELGSSVALHYLRRALIDFCEQSMFWREEVGPLRILEGVNEYEVFAPAFTEIVGVTAVSVNKQGKVYPFKPSATDISGDYRFNQIGQNEIEIGTYTELYGKDISVTAALKPKLIEDRMMISSNVINEYRDTILSGAKAKIYLMPRKEWSDINVASVHNNAFEDGVRKAHRHQTQGFSRVSRGASPKSRLFY